MKILIWLGCAFVYGLIVTGLSTSGIMLGALPTMCLLGCMIFAGRYFCKEYDTHKKDRQPKTTPIKSAASMSKKSLTKISQVPIPKPTEQHAEKSAPTTPASNSYKNAFTITLIVAVCLFLSVTILSLRYYYNVLELKEIIFNDAQTIRQLELDMESINNELSDTIKQLEIAHKYANKSRAYFYNDGFKKGYLQGCNDASIEKKKVQSIDDLWPESLDKYLLPYE